MKNPTQLFVLVCLFICFSFVSKHGDLKQNFIKVGETIFFSNKNRPNTITKKSEVHRKSNDLSGFDLEMDSTHSFKISNISQAEGPKQDNFTIINCSGKLSRDESKMFIEIEKTGKKFFLFSLDKEQIAAEFDNVLSIELVATKPNGEKAEYYCSERALWNMNKDEKEEQESLIKFNKVVQKNINLIAVPSNISKKDLFAVKHKPETLANFTRIEITTNDGNKHTFPSGSYIFCEGSNFDIRN
ncbi:MAG: hypothetical protein ACOVO9_08935 [Bacteroidia bacterium]